MDFFIYFPVTKFGDEFSVSWFIVSLIILSWIIVSLIIVCLKMRGKVGKSELTPLNGP